MKNQESKPIPTASRYPATPGIAALLDALKAVHAARNEFVGALIVIYGDEVFDVAAKKYDEAWQAVEEAVHAELVSAIEDALLIEPAAEGWS